MAGVWSMIWIFLIGLKNKMIGMIGQVKNERVQAQVRNVDGWFFGG